MESLKEKKENILALSDVERNVGGCGEKEKKNLVFPSCSGFGSMYSYLKCELHKNLFILTKIKETTHLSISYCYVRQYIPILVSMRHDECQNNQRLQMTQHLFQSNNDITTVLSSILWCQITQYEIQNSIWSLATTVSKLSPPPPLLLPPLS